jgi:DNA primase
MAKISPVSIKYMIHATFSVEGALEKPDVIGAVFGQTEGLLGSDLDMRELQKEGKIGRVEVELDRKDKRTEGKIQIPSALEQSETTLIAAAIETIDRIGPCDANIEVEKIEDVRGSKRDYIVDRAKKLMKQFGESTDSRQISNEIKYSVRTSEIKKFGNENLPCGDLNDKEIIVVEGRADVLNLLRAGVNNVIGMNGTKLPDTIFELGKEKDLILFLDGDRGGKLIAQNAVDNVKVKAVAVAPEGKEVEELTSKEILMALRKKMSLEDYLKKNKMRSSYKGESKKETSEVPEQEEIEIHEETKSKLKGILGSIKGSGKAVLLNNSLEETNSVSNKGMGRALKSPKEPISAIVLDGNVTKSIVQSAEEAGVQIIVANNFSATSDKIKMLSL